MRVLKLTLLLSCLLAAVFVVLPTRADPRDLGRETLTPNDGWASEGAGTTGGAAATPDQVYVVTNRQELVAALNNGVYPPPSNPSDVPKIIYVSGVIDVNVDDNNAPLVCEDYYRDGYTLDAFLATYDPAVWGRVPPSGPLEDARLVSRNAQQARVRIRVGSNTTIVGLDKEATIQGAWFDLRGTTSVNRTNIIIRNLNFVDTYDCFPAWSPTDGALGSWNALYDSISLRNTDHVWIDHNRFEDVATSDHLLPHYFGVLYQVHDGLVDITNASDFVTVSWNRFLNHDKVMLIGSSDGATADRGKLRVTLHHNLFASTGQRTPRVRFGQVHIYNNVYKIGGHVPHVYNWGVGIESAIYAENNLFTVANGVTPNLFMARFNGAAVHETGTLWSPPLQPPYQSVDVRAAYNAVNDPDLAGDVGWTPTLFTEVEPTQQMARPVLRNAGPFDW